MYIFTERTNMKKSLTILALSAALITPVFAAVSTDKMATSLGYDMDNNVQRSFVVMLTDPYQPEVDLVQQVSSTLGLSLDDSSQRSYVMMLAHR